MRLYEYDYYEDVGSRMSSASQYCLRWNNHQTNLLSAFELLLRQDAFTDVTLSCEDGVPLRAHRLVLASCSSYFATLFEATSAAHYPIVVLKDVQVKHMRALLLYMYQGEVNVDQSELKDLLKIAEGLKIKGLVEDLASNTQTQPLPLVTSETNAQPIPLLVSNLNRRTPTVTPSPSPDTRVTPSYNDCWDLEAPYPASSTRSVHSPPQSPYFRHKIEPKEEPLPRVPSPHSSTPYFVPYLPSHPDLSQVTRLSHLPFDFRDHHRSLREIYDQEKHDRFERRDKRPSSCDLRERRLSPAHLPYPISEPDSPPIKRPRSLTNDGAPVMLSPTPILRSALGVARSFPTPDVTSLVSLANSMMPIPNLLSHPPGVAAIAVEAQREAIESYSLQLPKKSEPLSDDDSRYKADITRDDETQEKINNGSLSSDFPNYHIDSNGPNLSNFVSYVPAPKPEWKRYKQYTKSDLMQAIDAVKKGMTALQASRKYKVPSRTLYDKIKKMGINTIPRRLPTKGRPPNTELNVSAEAMLHFHPSNTPLLRPRSSEELFERPQSNDSHGLSGAISPAAVEDRKDSPSSSSEEPILEAARGSFSLVGTKVFDGAGPLDLTDSETAIHARAQIQERA